MYIDVILDSTILPVILTDEMIDSVFVNVESFSDTTEHFVTTWPNQPSA